MVFEEKCDIGFVFLVSNSAYGESEEFFFLDLQLWFWYCLVCNNDLAIGIE